MINMADPFKYVLDWVQQNFFFVCAVGLSVYVFLMYFKIKNATKTKIIDREEVERSKFVEAMRFNRTRTFKKLVKADIRYFNGQTPNPIIGKTQNIGYIQSYHEFEQVPIKMVEREGQITYDFVKNVKPMRLIALVIKEPFLGIMGNPFKKSQPMFIETETAIKDEKGKRLIIPGNLDQDKFMGYYYAINEDMKPKIRNIIDARVLVNDFNLMASRYWAKGQEQAVYSPEVASQMAQLEKQLQIELAKKKGQQQTL